MGAITSPEDLKRFREEALEKRKSKSSAGKAQVIVGMGTCGIAAGAHETFEAILNEIEGKNLSGITAAKTGCIGLCQQEPIVQVVVGEGPPVTYGKVDPSTARRILREHVIRGEVLEDHVIEA